MHDEDNIITKAHLSRDLDAYRVLVCFGAAARAFPATTAAAALDPQQTFSVGDNVLLLKLNI